VLKKTGMGLQPRGRGFYRIVASSSLGSREKICLIEVGETWLVVGMTAHSMNTLHTLPAGSISITGSSPAASEQFAKLLGHFKPKPKDPKS
jgi:flagellar protein FliO/FliZ